MQRRLKRKLDEVSSEDLDNYRDAKRFLSENMAAEIGHLSLSSPTAPPSTPPPTPTLAAGSCYHPAPLPLDEAAWAALPSPPPSPMAVASSPPTFGLSSSFAPLSQPQLGQPHLLRARSMPLSASMPPSDTAHDTMPPPHLQRSHLSLALAQRLQPHASSRSVAVPQPTPPPASTSTSASAGSRPPCGPPTPPLNAGAMRPLHDQFAPFRPLPHAQRSSSSSSSSAGESPPPLSLSLPAPASRSWSRSVAPSNSSATTAKAGRAKVPSTATTPSSSSAGARPLLGSTSSTSAPAISKCAGAGAASSSSKGAVFVAPKAAPTSARPREAPVRILFNAPLPPSAAIAAAAVPPSIAAIATVATTPSAAGALSGTAVPPDASADVASVSEPSTDEEGDTMELKSSADLMFPMSLNSTRLSGDDDDDDDDFEGLEHSRGSELSIEMEDGL